MKKKSLYLITLVSLIFISGTSEAAFVIKNGKIRDSKFAATLPVQEHFDLGMQAFNTFNFFEAAKQFRIVVENFPRSTFTQDSFFYLGVSEYELEEYDYANDAFSDYLKSKNNPKHFQEAIEYKFNIAEKFSGGSRRRFLGTRRLPKWASANTLALKIYDEVIASLASHELAAQALISKGNLHWQLQLYRQAIEDFQLLIKRFPKNEKVPEAYVSISHVYLELSAYELQNPDILNFAEMNYKKFKLAFPREERLAEVEQDIEDIKEAYAFGLYDTGRFYERTCHPQAALIYYQNVLNQFPETQVAECASERMEIINPSDES